MLVRCYLTILNIYKIGGFMKEYGDVITMSDDLNVVNAVKNFILTHVEHAILKSKYHDIRFK